MLLSGDGAVNLLIEQAGYLLYYDPQIIVHHHIAASRVTRTWFRRRYFWQGVSMNKLHRYVEEKAKQLGLPAMPTKSRHWERISVPTSAAAWADLFDDSYADNFIDQIHQFEHLGYLLESQSVVVGR